MSKKQKRSKRKGWLINPQQVEVWLNKASEQLIRADYAGVVQTCQRILRYAPTASIERVDALHYLGVAHSMLQDFDQAYEALSEALTLRPNDPDLWYNRGLASRFTTRSGQALRDHERAVELGSIHELRDKFVEALDFSRKLAQASLELRGPNFALDQLIEQEELFQQGLKLMANHKWSEAEAIFRRVIAMGDCLPQPWANLAGSLLMQKRYDEAEAAWKRALEIDPDYELARVNLALLPETRRQGPPKSFKMVAPFEGHDLKKSITFLKG